MRKYLFYYSRNDNAWCGGLRAGCIATGEFRDLQGSGSAESTAPENTGAPVVYMTTDISSDGLMAIYETLGASPEGSIAVKLSTGEPGSKYLLTDLIGELVQSLDASIVECNTAYRGSRASTAMHYQVAEDFERRGGAALCRQ